MRNRKTLITGTCCIAALLGVLSVGLARAQEETAGGPLKPDLPIAKGYDNAARALAMIDDNPVIRWEYRIWCETGHRHVGEAGAGQVVDAPLDIERDHFSPNGFHHQNTGKRWMPEGGARFMDNAWYVGQDGTGGVIVRTPDGLIVLDTLRNGIDYDRVLKEMPAAGLNPKDIKYIFLGHHHGDHVGGVKAILRVAPNAKVVAGGPDADMIEAGRQAVLNGTVKSLPPENHAVAGWRNPPPTDPAEAAKLRALRLDSLPDKVDIRIEPQPGLKTGSKTIRIGPSTEVVAILAPGHTVGQMHVVVPVMHKGKMHKLLVWSGNDLVENAWQYAISTDYVRTVAGAAGADALINTHGYQSSFFYHVRQAHANPSGPNPIVMGPDGVDRYLGIFADCQRAMYYRLKDGTWARG